MTGKMKINIKLNNIVFECYLEKGKMYNAELSEPHFISIIVGVLPHPQDPTQTMLDIRNVAVCQECYKKNEGKEGLQFKDPSKIVKPDSSGIIGGKN